MGPAVAGTMRRPFALLTHTQHPSAKIARIEQGHPDYTETAACRLREAASSVQMCRSSLVLRMG
jgi:hypothetical protein